MRGGLLRGKPPLLFLRSGILAGQGSFLYAESRNKQNWRDIDMRFLLKNPLCAHPCGAGRRHMVFRVRCRPVQRHPLHPRRHSRLFRAVHNFCGCWARMSAARKRSRSMIASNGHAPKRFGETRSHTFMCVQRVSGALPLTSRGQFFAAAETARKAKWVPLCPACHVFSRPSQRCFLCFPA